VRLRHLEERRDEAVEGGAVRDDQHPLARMGLDNVVEGLPVRARTRRLSAPGLPQRSSYRIGDAGCAARATSPFSSSHSP
jgi:hypothetical protein